MPATKLLDGEFSCLPTHRKLILNYFLAFLGGGDLPEPKSLSETASRMLSVISKPVEYVIVFSPSKY